VPILYGQGLDAALLGVMAANKSKTACERMRKVPTQTQFKAREVVCAAGRQRGSDTKGKSLTGYGLRQT